MFRRTQRWPAVAVLVAMVSYVLVVSVTWAVSTDGPPAPASTDQGSSIAVPSWFVIALLLTFVGAGIVGVLDVYRSKVVLAPDGLVRDRLGRRRMIPWSEITGAVVVTGPNGRHFAVPAVVLSEGSLVRLRELEVRTRWPLSRAKVDAEVDRLVALVDQRVGRTTPLIAPTAMSAPRIMTLSRGFVTAAIVILLVPAVVMLLVFVSLLFATSKATVDPALLPEGRSMTGYERLDGSVVWRVDCPAPITAARGDDPLCRDQGRSLVRVVVIGLPISLVIVVALVLGLVANRRRPRSAPVPVVRITDGWAWDPVLGIDELSGPLREVADVVRRSLSPEGAAASTVRVNWDRPGTSLVVEVIPEDPEAASIEIGADGPGLQVVVGDTSFRINHSPADPDGTDQLAQIVAAVASGGFVEARRGSRRFGRIELASGAQLQVGPSHLPLPWSWRRPHRYAAY